MKYAPFAGIVGVGVMTLALGTAQALAHRVDVPNKTNELAQAFKGKMCTTKTGAKLTFGTDGLYAYDGLWTNGGRYSVRGDVITVTLDNGLERDFTISRKGDVLYMEQTVISCTELARP